jgi:hypothetical protein
MAKKKKGKTEHGVFTVGKALIGKTALAPIARGAKEDQIVHFKVRIKDFKHTYGRDEFLVEPIDGTGEYWARKLVFAS